MNKILSLLMLALLGPLGVAERAVAVPPSEAAYAGQRPPAYNQQMAGGLCDFSNPDAPHEIHSTEISSFSCDFSGYTLSLVREGEKAIMRMACDSSRRGQFFMPTHEQDYSFEMRLPVKVLSDLDRLIKKNEVARINGWHKRNAALGCTFALKVEYTSGESLAASGEGGSSVLPGKGWVPMEFVAFFLTTAKAYGLNMQEARENWKKRHQK